MLPICKLSDKFAFIAYLSEQKRARNHLDMSTYTHKLCISTSAGLLSFSCSTGILLTAAYVNGRWIPLQES